MPSQLTGLAASIVADAQDAVLAVDRDSKIVVWNDGCEQLFGWRADEMLGRPPNVLLPQDRMPELERAATALAGVRETAALETVRLHKAGHLVHVSRRVSPIVDPSGAVIGACAIFRDIGREVALRRELETARNLADARFRQSVVAQATLAPDGSVLDVNPALCELSGFRQSELLGRSVLEFMIEPELEVASDRLARLGSGELTDSRHSRRLRRSDGQVIDTRVSIFSVRDESSGEVLRLEAMIEDVTAAAAAARELQLREAQWQSLSLNSADVGLFCNAEAAVLSVSSSVLPQFGYRPDDVIGAIGFSFWHPDDEPGVRAVWEAAVDSASGSKTVFEARLRHADGSWRWVEETVTNRLADPAIAAMVVNLKDVSERKSTEIVLEELAGQDSLTGLPTRGPLMAALDAAFAAERAAETAVAVFDAARFKLVNDSFGHRGGDAVLVEIANRLLAAVAEEGVVARLGGDRFAVLFAAARDVSDVYEDVAELLAEIERPIEVFGKEVSVTAAVGAALGPAVDGGSLLGSAESALSTAKLGQLGPMHVVRAESSSASVRRARLVEDLRRGIAADEFVVHFQPVVAVTDGRPVGAEALVRWQHPEKGLLAPGAFIEAAEESGLILPIGSAVLTQACRMSARWTQAHPGKAFQLAVNLSAAQLTGGGVADVVRAALEDTGAAPQHLMLEVTESAVMSDMDQAVRTLQELRALGVAIAIDDFGTGYSSLTYLKQFPVTALKIDRSFVSGLGRNADDAAIVSSVVNLARAMDLECIAEGVETEQQRLVLQALGCPFAQGFLWSRAVDAAAFAQWVAAAPAGRQASRRRSAVAASEQADDQPSQPLAGPVDEAMVLRRIRQMCAAGASMNTIAAALNAEQLLTQQGRRWTSRSVATLLATQPPG